MRRVVLESPYKGDVAENVAYAKKCIVDCLTRNEAPIASHLLFTQRGILLDSKPEQRQKGISAGHAWIESADAVVVYVDQGISSGMKAGVAEAQRHKVAVEIRKLDTTLSETEIETYRAALEETY